jgi:hypothetical protein
MLKHIKVDLIFQANLCDLKLYCYLKTSYPLSLLPVVSINVKGKGYDI